MTAPGRAFRLFASCIPVRGAVRSTLCDLQGEQWVFIPNGLHEVLTEHRGRTPDEVKAAYDNRFDAQIDEYYRFLEEGGFGFWTDHPEAFPDLDLTWERPERITHAIVDVGEGSEHDWGSLLPQLDELGCRALQVRWFRDSTPAEAADVLDRLRSCRLSTVELLVPWSAEWEAAVEALSAAHPRISAVFLHSAPETLPMRTTSRGAAVHLRAERVTSASHCGHAHPGYFVVNLDSFSEATRYNSCLNRKISVDEHGDIRNCPAMPVSYGKASEVPLASALARAEFREAWEINKDQVQVCRDCEFRYVCSDCRAFLTDPDDRYSKPSKCGYDPYSATWA